MGRKSIIEFIIFFTVFSFLSTTCSKADSPSSCGNIKNISCPFTLKGDYQKCHGFPFIQELSCDINNRTVLDLFPDERFYYVESINYDDNHLTMRIVDPGLQKNNYSSLPFFSILENDIGYSDSYDFTVELNQPITIIECPSRPENSTRYINITSPSSSYSSSVLGKYYVYSYAYMVVGELSMWELEDNCRISKVAWVSLQSLNRNVLSNYSGIHDAMVNGFDLPWSYFYCLKCGPHIDDYDGFNGFDCHAYYSLDYHHWECERAVSQSCSLWHLSKYDLSLSCFRQNWRGIMDQLRRGKIREYIGEVAGLIFGGRFFFGNAIFACLVGL